MRLAITHDFLNQFGGAERSLEALVELYPNTPIHTFNYDRNLPIKFNPCYIKPSFMNNLPFSRSMHYWYLPFYAPATRAFDLGTYDVVLNNLSAWTKNIPMPSSICHIIYCNTPIRFLWELLPRLLQILEGSSKNLRPP